MTECPIVVSSLIGGSQKFNTLLSVMLSIEVCTAWSDAFFVLASNGTTVWLCIVKNVSFISPDG